MQVIKEIKIENFQSHRSTNLKFNSGLNIITGPSDNGKSAIVRALRWVLYNEPLGDDFIRVGASRCRVGILLGNGYRVIRERSNKENRYIIVDPAGEKEIYTGFGTKVPQEVITAHRMPKVTLDDDLEDTLNLDYQLSGPFLLNDSGSTRAKAIGQLTGVHIIDSAIKGVAIDLRRAQSEKKKELNEIEAIDEKLKDYQDLPQLKKEITRKNKLLKDIKRIKAKLDKQQSLQKEWEKVKKEQAQLQKTLSKLDQLEKVEKLYQQITETRKRLSKLQGFWQDWQEINKNKQELKQVLKKLSNLDKINDHYQQLEKILRRRRELVDYKDDFKDLKLKIKTGQKFLQKTESLEQVEKLLAKVSTKKEKYTRLKNIAQDWTEVNKELQHKQKILAKLPARKKVHNLLNQIKETKAKLDKLKEINTFYQKNKENIQKGKEYIQEIDQNIERKLNLYKNKLRKANRCPLCFSEIADEVLEQIIDNYRLGG